MDDTYKHKLTLRLQERIPSLHCPMCEGKSFSVVDGYITNMLQQDYKNIQIPSQPIIPAVAIVCNTCGFISQHALGALGLLETENDVDNQ